MSHFDDEAELKNIENLQQQTRDPFQLELLDAVKRRQKKETGFDDGAVNTQRHSKELDIKMSKYLANKQSPFREDNSSKGLTMKGDNPETMSLGTSAINNKRTTNAQNSRWSPSINVDSEDDIEDDIDSDEDDGLVIGHSRKLSYGKPRSGLDKLKENRNIENDASPGLSGLNTRKETTKIREKGNAIGSERKSSGVERPGLQKKKEIIKDATLRDGSFLSKDLAPKKQLEPCERGKENEEDNNTMERRRLEKKGKFEVSVDTDDEEDGIFDGMSHDNEIRLDPGKKSKNIEPSPRTKSEIDDIFGQAARRKPSSLKEDEGNIRDDFKARSLSRNETTRHGDDTAFDRKLNDKTPRSRSGSQKDHKSSVIEFDRPKSRESSGRNTPSNGFEPARAPLSRKYEVDPEKSFSRSGRKSPVSPVSSSIGKPAKSDDERVKSRSGSGRDSPSNTILANSKEVKKPKEARERPKSAKIRNNDASVRSISRSGKMIESDSDEEIVRKHSTTPGREKQIARETDSPSTTIKDSTRSPRPKGNDSSRHRRSHSDFSPRSEEQNEISGNSLRPRDPDKGRPRSKSEAHDRNETARSADRSAASDIAKKENDNIGSKYGLRKSGSLRSLHDKNKQSLLGSDDDDDDDEIDSIGLKRSGRSLSQFKRENEQQKSESAKTPGIRRALVPDGTRSQKLDNKERKISKEDEIDSSSGFAKQRTKKDDKHQTQSLNKFKIKGRGEGASSKASPMKANMTMTGAASVPNKTRKSAKDSSPREGMKQTTNRAMTKRSLSFTNISNISPKSPYKDQEDGEKKRKTSFVDSNSLREQIYYDWLKQKTSKTKGELAELRKREKEKEEEAEKEKIDKKVMSQKAFEAWQANKEDYVKEKQSSIKEKKTKEKEKKYEIEQKKLDAKKFFESWKTKKEEELMEKHRMKKEEAREKRRKEMEEREDKKSSSKKVFDNWKAQKDEVLKEKLKEKKEQEKEKRMKEIEKREKKQAAQKMFETWKEKKVKSPREDMTLTQRAWCPASRNTGHIIPQEVKPVVQRNPPNRARTLSATGRLQNGTMRSTFART